MSERGDIGKTVDIRVPWYRVPVMWIVILGPLTAVIGGFVTLALAIVSNDGLVEDDYYQQGKQINLVLDRDHAARRYGLEGTIDLDNSGHGLRLRLHARHLATMPGRVRVKLLYATRAGFDHEVNLSRTADGSYYGVLPTLRIGHWYVQAEAGDWRLVGSIRLPEATTLHIEPAGKPS